MLLGAARSSGWHMPMPGRLVQHPYLTLTVPRSTPATKPTIYYSSQLRIFATQGALRKPATPDQQKPGSPASSQQLKDGAKETPSPPKKAGPATLLGEKETGNKAQRKADWAIMKEMSKYLWPKV